jgi:malto-oligosyltrehalose synthase/4-alpha-glucanotransferase
MSPFNLNLLLFILPFMLDPVSTYRIQFNKNFTFSDFSAMIPYLNDLGVKTIYASPIYEAVPGSMHGYDVINANHINPEIGTLEELRSIAAQLKELDMYWIQDIVPNHMGFHEGNAWLMDVLKNGEKSPYRGYFDLITKDLNTEPLMVPFLGEDLDEVIEKGGLELISKEGSWFFKYYESLWPLRESTIPGGTDKTDLDLRTIANQQYYRLCCYKETSSRINYRRFFTVNSLICLNVQDESVFSDYHQLTSSLIGEGIFQGLRIDHVDGLADPTGYLEQLRLLCGKDTYIVVEKILEPGEALTKRWPVQGTTGYDYLGLVNQLFTNKKAEQKFDKFYRKMGRGNSAVHQQILTKKRRFLATYMQGELDNLFELMMDCGILPPGVTDEAQSAVFRGLIGEILVRCPVYRLYSNQFPLLAEEEEVWEEILEDIEKDEKYTSAVGLFRDQMNVGGTADPGNNANAIVFFQRLMQFSGPLMAKGVEDTLMYTYNRFIGNNEVGDSPELFGISIGDFQEQVTARQRNWPHAMNATATHDTKRGEDARSRLAVLTDLRDEWIAEVKVWQELNESLKASGAPDANDEYFIYQTLIATYPEGDAVGEHYEERLLDYIEKALRESKRNSEWEEPDLEYESHTKDFIQYLLDPQREFWKRFLSFHRRLTGFARLTSLTSVLLKHTLPGVPDTYQGTELWDLSMVDPDNRRPVDYEMRAGLLAEMALKKFDLRELWEHKHDGLIKIYLLQTLLVLRREHPVLFADGLYIPLVAKGRYAAHVLAFARRHKENWLIVCLPVNIAAISTNTALEADWEDTRIVLPENLEGSYLDVLQKKQGSLKMKPVNELRLSVLFAEFPMAALLFKREERKRGAGVLMHVSSLPSNYGIGDFGPAAENFLSFMADSALKYWQVLPMNPLSAAEVYSPYSATSVMAGNTMLISPEELHREGLLTSADLDDHRCGVKRNVSYPSVKKSKDELLRKAYQSWLINAGPVQSAELADFITKEAFWLEDFSMFEVIRELQNNNPWPEWPVQLRDRNTEALKSLQQKHHRRLEEMKWRQFIFFRQWARIKHIADTLGIHIIGDIPFYTAIDSVDVWAKRKMFALDGKGKITGIAGVPPDYFNEEGQLWGMPVFNWKAMSATGYKWWLDRITKNLELYDLIRLDHFRAFSAYWEVPAGSDTARHGSWKPGPGKSFFEVLKSKLGKLPLIAEDLGEISQDVYELRDAFGLPGMKVLQFAFGEDVSESIHAPHNFKNNNCVVYTGTHDNNTTRGWFEEEADAATKDRLETYFGMKITKHNSVYLMICMALSSTADLAIFPMQDFLNKPSKDRMNTPASTKHNWTWRLKPDELKAVGTRIREKLRLYGR